MVFDSYDRGIRGWNTTHSIYGTSRTIHLMQDVCDNFTAYGESVSSGRIVSYLQHEAVNIATHEAIHASGVSSEARTNCYAIQRSEQTARALGAPAAVARETRRVAAQLTSSTLPAVYHSAACHPSGEYDLGLDTSGVFPTAVR
jgi:hypothetical protein